MNDSPTTNRQKAQSRAEILRLANLLTQCLEGVDRDLLRMAERALCRVVESATCEANATEGALCSRHACPHVNIMHEPADYSVGIMAEGYWCEDCDADVTDQVNAMKNEYF